MLRQDDSVRVLVCYGHGEAQAALGYGVQEALHELRLLIEALYPQFNRYVGAEAIGSASSLYVTRPTKRSWAAAEKKGRSSARIYSGGKASLESAAAAPVPVDIGAAPRSALARPPRAGSSRAGRGSSTGRTPSSATPGARRSSPRRR